MADGAIRETVRIWVQRRESRNRDISGEKVANAARIFVINIPDIGFEQKLERLDQKWLKGDMMYFVPC